MIRLTHGEDSLTITAEHGGSIVEWTSAGTHRLRPPSPDAMTTGEPGAMGCFPLVPYCNRIAFRRFNWAGAAFELAPNFGDHPHAIHGVGWKQSWDVEAVSSDSATLSLHHDGVNDAALAWPFPFASRLGYRLTDAGLIIEIDAVNLHHAAAPMGIGIHPYFPRPSGATIAFQADGVWRNDNALPLTHQTVPPSWDHAHGRSPDGEPLDNCYTGWARRAVISGLRMEADAALRNLQVFTPRGADFMCIEPVSHVPDSINRPDLPKAQAMTVLEPGQTLSGRVKLSAG